MVPDISTNLSSYAGHGDTKFAESQIDGTDKTTVWSEREVSAAPGTFHARFLSVSIPPSISRMAECSMLLVRPFSLKVPEWSMTFESSEIGSDPRSPGHAEIHARNFAPPTDCAPAWAGQALASF